VHARDYDLIIRNETLRKTIFYRASREAQRVHLGAGHPSIQLREKRPKPRNSPSHNHDSTAPRHHPLIYTGAGLIHPVHGPLWSPATKAIAPKGFTFSPF